MDNLNMAVVGEFCRGRKEAALENKASRGLNESLEYMEKTFTDSPLVPSEIVKEADEWVAYIQDTFTSNNSCMMGTL
jgi:hypothetical protein